MRFAFEEQQVEFRAQLRTLLERECTAADLRNSFDLALSESAPDRRRWEQLASMGVVGLTVPEREGGLGLGAVDLVGLLEEAGRAGLPEPLSETAALVVPFLVDIVAEQDGEADQADESAGEAAGSEAREKARQWLRRIAAGEAIATVVCDVASPAGPVVPAARADPAGPGVWAGVADVVVVFAPGRIVLLPGAEVDATEVSSIDSTRLLATVTVAQGSGSGSVLVEGPRADVHLARLRNRGAFSASAVLLGAADRLMSMTREYALERQQFGRPIGSFQAVKHHLASAYVKLEMARPLTYKAAWSLDDDPDSAGRDCSIAKATASEAALEVARTALQIHGAMGYTWEHDIHLWMKRIWVVVSSWGDASEHYAAVLDSLASAGAGAGAGSGTAEGAGTGVG